MIHKNMILTMKEKSFCQNYNNNNNNNNNYISNNNNKIMK